MGLDADITETGDSLPKFVAGEAASVAPMLCVIWAAEGLPLLSATLAAPVGDRWVFGRGASGEARLLPQQMRPGRNIPAGELQNPKISREQLEIANVDDTRLSIRNIGRCPMAVDGLPCDEALVGPGQILELRNQLMMLVVQRPQTLPGEPIRWGPATFGVEDAFGMVGESPLMWALRLRIDQLAPRAVHVLVTGQSGTGKELVARALHGRMRGEQRPFVSRNAATLPESLVDAELFGNMRNYRTPACRPAEAS